MLHCYDIFLMINGREDKGYIMEKTNPLDLGDYVLIFFKSNGFLRTADGEMKPFRPNTCLLYTPNFPRYLSCPDEPLIHDWISFKTSDESFLHKNVIKNDLFIPPEDFIQTNFFPLIYNQYVNQSYRWHENINCLMTAIFNILFESRRPEDIESQYTEELKKIFRQIRQKIYALDYQGNVSDFARQYNFSRSHFTLLYQLFFNVPPAADMTKARIQTAKHLLSTTGMTLTAIAEKCGYSNEFTFIRAFIRTEGISPTAFRKSR